MNIFYLDRAPAKAAKYHSDKHVVKMLVESVQILSTALHLNGHDIPGAYKPTHKNHPCVKWVAASGLHYNWLRDLAKGLSVEYTRRYGKTHKSSLVLRLLPVMSCSYYIPNRSWTEPPQAMPDEYRCDDTVKAYRDYYMGEKRHIAKWYKGDYKPSWYK